MENLKEYIEESEKRVSEDFGLEYFILEYLSSKGEFSQEDIEYLEEIGLDADYFFKR